MLKLIAELYGGAHHTQLNLPRYIDADNPKQQDTRTAEQIIDDVFKGLKK